MPYHFLAFGMLWNASGFPLGELPKVGVFTLKSVGKGWYIGLSLLSFLVVHFFPLFFCVGVQKCPDFAASRYGHLW